MTSPGPAKQPFHRLNQPTKKRITTIRPAVVIGSIIAFVLVVLVSIWLSFGKKPTAKEVPPVPPSSTAIASMAHKTLADFPTEPVPPAIPDATAEAAAVPGATEQPSTPSPPQGRGTDRRPPPPPDAPAGLPAPGQGRRPGTGVTRHQREPSGEHPQTRDGKEKRKPWLSEESKAAIDKPPFPEEDKEGTQGRQRRAEEIFPQAAWARPARPELVLYQDQLVHGILMADFNSDIPSLVLVLVTQQVEDRWGQGSVLIPQYAVLVGKPTSALAYGKTAVEVPITSGIWPDGTGVILDGNIGNSRGAAGLTGKVNNHLSKLVLGTVLTAALNIGARVPFGSSSNNYNQNLPQEFSQDFAQGINQAGQAIIQRQLNVNPTLTQTHGFAVSVSFNKNISFQSEPVIAHK